MPDALSTSRSVFEFGVFFREQILRKDSPPFYWSPPPFCRSPPPFCRSPPPFCRSPPPFCRSPPPLSTRGLTLLTSSLLSPLPCGVLFPLTLWRLLPPHHLCQPTSSATLIIGSHVDGVSYNDRQAFITLRDTLPDFTVI